MPLSKLIGHIHELYRDISLRHEKHQIRKYVSHGTKQYRKEFWGFPCIRLAPHTPPESLRTSEDDTRIFRKSSDDLICHLLSHDMLEWLDIDMS